ncbi:hypothetical protein C0J52_24757 [Blattella germanica]|nr:hypothetical protein C0J52_24757 [Blattella germanica]
MYEAECSEFGDDEEQIGDMESKLHRQKEQEELSTCSFQMRPEFDERFRAVTVKELIHSTMSDELAGKTYTAEDAEVWCKKIARDVRNKVKDLGFKRYKFMVQVVLGEQHGAGVKIGSRCLWDADTDNYASDVFINILAIYCTPEMFSAPSNVQYEIYKECEIFFSGNVYLCRALIKIWRLLKMILTERKLQQTEQKLAMSEKGSKKKDVKLAELQKKISHLKKNANQTSEGSSTSLVSPKVYEEESDSMESKQDGPPDFIRLIQCIEDLNQLVGYGEPQLTYTNNGASFKNPESIPLVLYADGLVLFSGPFRAYSNHGTQLFIQDILDGFFPSELQHAYPDGVCFKVTDRHEVHYRTGRKWKPFEGKGYTLGSKEQKPNNRSTTEEEDYVSSCNTNVKTGENRSPDRLKPEWKSSVLNTVFNVSSAGATVSNVCRQEEQMVLPQKLKIINALPKKMEQVLNSSTSAMKKSKCDSCKSSTTSLVSVKSSTKQSNKNICFKEDNLSEQENKLLAVCKTKSSSSVSGRSRMSGNTESCEDNVKISKSRPSSPYDKVKHKRYKRDNPHYNSASMEENVALKPLDSEILKQSSSKHSSKSTKDSKNSPSRNSEKEATLLLGRKNNLDLEPNKIPPSETNNFQTIVSELECDVDRNKTKEEKRSKCSKHLFKDKISDKNTCSTTLLNKNTKHRSKLDLINEERYLDVSSSELLVTTDSMSESVERVVPSLLDVDPTQTPMHHNNSLTQNDDQKVNKGTNILPKSSRVKKCKSILPNQNGPTPLLRELDRIFLAASSRLTALEMMEAEVARKSIADPFGKENVDLVDCKTLTAEEFLKKLPSKVVRNGKVIDVRGGVAEILKVMYLDGLTFLHCSKQLEGQDFIQVYLYSSIYCVI